MKFIKRCFGHQLNNYIGHKKKEFNPYREYNLKIAKEKDNLERKENILIAIIGGSAYSHTFEGIFARKAILSGKNIYVLHCDGYLDYCESIQNKSKHKKMRCAVCMAQQEDFIKAFGVNSCTYEDNITEKEEKEISNFINSFFERMSSKHHFLNVKIDKILYSALQRYYLIADPVVNDDAVTRGFLRTIIATLIVMDKLVKKIKPQYVLSSHGTYSTWGAVVEYCKAHDIYVITHGQTYNRCAIGFTYDDSYLTGDLNDTENKWQTRELTSEDSYLVRRFFDERLGRINDDNVAFDYNKNNKVKYTKEQLCHTLNIKEETKIVGLFPNIPWDGQVMGNSAVFPKFRDWLKTTIDYIKDKEGVVLVIRSHPAEVLDGDGVGRETTATMLMEMYGDLPQNVILLDPKHHVSSYALGVNCEFGITYSSTVSLELTYLGIPVILCGCPPFHGKNIAFDITSKEHYFSLLDSGIEGKLDVDNGRVDRLFKYMHYFFFMRTMPQTLVKINDTIPQKYLFKTEKELAEDPVFNDMFECIENKKEMNFSRFHLQSEQK